MDKFFMVVMLLCLVVFLPSIIWLSVSQSPSSRSSRTLKILLRYCAVCAGTIGLVAALLLLVLG